MMMTMTTTITTTYYYYYTTTTTTINITTTLSALFNRHIFQNYSRLCRISERKPLEVPGVGWFLMPNQWQNFEFKAAMPPSLDVIL